MKKSHSEKISPFLEEISKKNIKISSKIEKNFVNKKLSNFFGWLTTFIMFIIAFFAILFILV